MNIFKHQLFIITCTLTLLANFSIAGDINLSDENEAKNLLLGKAFYCSMKETNYTGPIKIEIKSISGKKFMGISKEWCHQTLQWTGSFKKNRMKITQKGASAQTCYCRSGSLTFTKNSDGDLLAEGHYGVACGATPFRGELKCVIK